MTQEMRDWELSAAMCLKYQLRRLEITNVLLPASRSWESAAFLHLK